MALLISRKERRREVVTTFSMFVYVFFLVRLWQVRSSRHDYKAYHLQWHPLIPFSSGYNRCQRDVPSWWFRGRCGNLLNRWSAAATGNLVILRGNPEEHQWYLINILFFEWLHWISRRCSIIYALCSIGHCNYGSNGWNPTWARLINEYTMFTVA